MTGQLPTTPGSSSSSNLDDEAVIRQLGSRRMHRYAERFWAGDEDNLRRYTLRFINESGRGTSPEVQQQLLRSGAGIPSANGLVLDPDNLRIIPSPAQEDRHGYRCPRCHAFFLHDVSICTECPPPTPLVVAEAPRDFDYYSLLGGRADTPYFRLNCEELTGHTRTERPRRQRWFQGDLS